MAAYFDIRVVAKDGSANLKFSSKHFNISENSLAYVIYRRGIETPSHYLPKSFYTIANHNEGANQTSN